MITSSLTQTFNRSILLVLLIYIFSGFAQAAGPKLSADGFKETIRKEVKTSGLYTAGVMVVVDNNVRARIARYNTIQISLPSTRLKKLCVDLRSVDAKYHATASFDISSTNSGVWRIDTSSLNAIRFSYSVHELVVDARIADTCDAYADTLSILAGWADADMTQKQFVVYLNSDGDNVEANFMGKKGSDDEFVSFACKSVPSELNHRVFDRYCFVPISPSNDYQSGWISFARSGTPPFGSDLRVLIAQ